MEGNKDIGEDISFQDIFSENFNSLIYEDVDEEEVILSGDPNPIESTSSSYQEPSVVVLDNQTGKYNFGEEIEALDEIPNDLSPSYMNAKLLNERYLIKLQDFLDNLILALEANQDRQNELEEEIQSLSGPRHLTLKKKESSRKPPSLKPHTFTVFCVPYFKDIRMFSHPDNPDTQLRKAQEELYVYTLQPPKWMESDKVKLKNAVLSDAVHKRIKTFLEEEADIQARLRNYSSISSSEVKTLEERLTVLSKRIKEVKKIPESELLQNRSEEFDWLKISTQSYKKTFSHECIRCMWRNLVHPSVKKGSWSQDEDARLQDLVLAHQGRDWDAIASALGTNRPAYLCFVRYQRKYKLKEYFRKKWNKDEDTRLCAIIKQCQISSYIPWSKVAYYMPHGRSKDMCYQRFILHINFKFSRDHFKMEEDFIIILGVHIFTTNWKAIARFLQKRSPVQINGRYHNFLCANLSPWTLKEDKALLQAIKATGTMNWKAIELSMPSRSRRQCRYRFMAIFRSYRKDPKSFDLEKCMNYSSCTSLGSKKRQDSIFGALDELLKYYLEAEEAVIEAPIPNEFLMKVLTLLSEDLALGRSRPKLPKPCPIPKENTKLSQKDLELRKKYNDFFRRFSNGKSGRERVRYKPLELGTFALFGTATWNLLDAKNTCKIANVALESPVEKSQQLLDIMASCPKDFAQKDEGVQRKPLLKTYSRKKPLRVSLPPSSSSSSSSSNNKLAPPTAMTCIGLKNTLSFIMDFAEKGKNAPWKREGQKATKKSELKGIFAENYSDMYMHLGLMTEDDERSPSPPDALLLKRFKSIFFWPAVLSTIGSERFVDASSSSSCKEEDKDDKTLMEQSQTPPPSKRFKLE